MGIILMIIFFSLVEIISYYVVFEINLLIVKFILNNPYKKIQNWINFFNKI